VRYVAADLPLTGGRVLATFPRGGSWGADVTLYAFKAEPRDLPPCR